MYDLCTYLVRIRQYSGVVDYGCILVDSSPIGGIRFDDLCVHMGRTSLFLATILELKGFFLSVPAWPYPRNDPTPPLHQRNALPKRVVNYALLNEGGFRFFGSVLLCHGAPTGRRVVTVHGLRRDDGVVPEGGHDAGATEIYRAGM